MIVTHRDPVAVIQSAITMLAYGDRIRRRTVDLAELADYWIVRIEHLLRACVRDRDAVPASQSLDVRFHEYMADPKTVIARVLRDGGAAAARPRPRRASTATWPRTRAASTATWSTTWRATSAWTLPRCAAASVSTTSGFGVRAGACRGETA